MTNEEMLSVAEIVERLVARFHKQADDHEAKMVEHRAAFGARTEADAKIIAGLREERDGLLTQVQDMRAEIERLKKPAPRAHPVAVGEWVKRTKFEHSEGTRINTIAQVVGFDPDGDYRVSVSGSEHCWRSSNCTPCDPPEATHDTEAGKAAAEAAVKTEPDEIKVGDVVRATSWKAGQAAHVKKILSDGRLMLDCSDQPWRVDEVVKLARKVTT